MDNIWFFGDSFTEAWNKDFRITPQEIYWSEYTNEKAEKWTSLLSKELGYVEQNLGKGGSSNDTIINNIYKNIYRFSKNDKIIISNTLETRFNIPDAKSKNILDFNGGHIIYHNEIPEYELFHLGKDVVNDLLVRYTVDTRQMYLKSWKKHYENKFLEVGKALKKLGYEVYFWPFEIWLNDKTQFERIREATNEKLTDGHFSEAGHITFFKFLSSNLNNFRL